MDALARLQPMIFFDCVPSDVKRRVTRMSAGGLKVHTSGSEGWPSFNPVLPAGSFYLVASCVWSAPST